MPQTAMHVPDFAEQPKNSLYACSRHADNDMAFTVSFYVVIISFLSHERRKTFEKFVLSSSSEFEKDV